MERFKNYKRLDIILYNIDTNHLIKKKSLKNKILETINSSHDFYTERLFDINITDNKILSKNNFLLEKLNYIEYKIFLDIKHNFFVVSGPYMRNYAKLIDNYYTLKRDSYMCIRYYTYDNKVKRYLYGLYNIKDGKINLNSDTEVYFSNNLITLNNRICIINILSYCLELLNSREIRYYIYTDINDEDKIKKIIIIFYYLSIYLMSFFSGSSSIAEMSLFTL